MGTFLLTKSLGTEPVSLFLFCFSSSKIKHMLNPCLFVYLGWSVGGHMLVHEQLMDHSRLIQKYKSG